MKLEVLGWIGVGVWFFLEAIFGWEHPEQEPAPCSCLEASVELANGGWYTPLYDACVKEVEAGRDVHTESCIVPGTRVAP